MSILDAMLWHVKSCCCGCTDLRVGTLIILWISVILAIMHVLGSLFTPTVFFWGTSGSIDNTNGNRPSYNRPSNNGPFGPRSYDGSGPFHPFDIRKDQQVSEDYTHHEPSGPLTVGDSTLLLTVLFLVVAACGLYGVIHRKSSFLLPYVILNVIGIIILWIMTTILVIGLFILKDFARNYFAQHGDYISQIIDAFLGAVIVAGIMVVLILSIIVWYLTSVVYRYYEQLELEERSEQGSAPRQDLIHNSRP